MLEISKNTMVTLTYDLRIDDENGEVIEQTTTDNPLRFLFGAGTMLPKFESHLGGLRQGEQFSMKLSSNDAYGEVNHDAIVELPKHIFIVDGKFDEKLIFVGNTVPMMSSNGQHLNGVVLEVNDENVKMDFNHPLAGEDLFFTGTVIEVRNATAEELTQVNHGCGCGCGSGDCDDSDCGSAKDEGRGCGC